MSAERGRTVVLLLEGRVRRLTVSADSTSPLGARREGTEVSATQTPAQGRKPVTVAALTAVPLPGREKRIACTVPVAVSRCHTTKLVPVRRTPDGNIGSWLEGRMLS